MMKKNVKYVVVAVFLLVNMLSAQNMEWKWSNSKFDVTPEANTAHFIGSAFLADFLETRGMEWWKADLTAMGLGLAWEIKDGFVDYRSVPVFGAEGFSKMDIIADFSGVIANRLLNVGLEKIFKLNRKTPKKPTPEDLYY
jgi:hypothetical protein